MDAVILSIGDELVLGQTVDTNAAWLAERLTAMGIGVAYHQTLADDRGVIGRSLQLAMRQSELVLITGGLGPTEDDLTREAIADALCRDLVEDADSAAAIERFFADRGRPMAQCNRVQAMHPAGTEMIPNACGTAPGISARFMRTHLYAMPGVPSEMRAMFVSSIEPALSGAADRDTILTSIVHSFGAGESDVGELLGDLMDRDRNPRVGTTVAGGVVSVRIRSADTDADRARDALEQTVEVVRQRLGAIVYGRDDEALPAVVVEMLRQRKLTIATAESCTGGLIGAALTGVPGSSAAYVGGWITYSNGMKTDRLGVSAGLIRRHGAVSEAVARAMAEGARQRSGAHLAVAVTGIAGPDGGTEDKPVGTVWLALADADGTQAMGLHLPGSRAVVRNRAALCALALARLRLLGEPANLIRWARPETTGAGGA